MLRKLTFIVLSLLGITAFSQTRLYVGANLSSGYLLKQVDSKGSILSNNFSLPLRTGGSFYLRLKDRIGIEAGMAQSALWWKLRDQDFASRNSGYKVNIDVLNFHYNFFGNFHFSLPLDEDNTYCYLQGGLSYNVIGKGTVSEYRVFPINNEELFMDANFSEYSLSVIPEIGIQKVYDRHWLFAIGLNYNFTTQGDLLNADYRIDREGTTVVTDKFRTDGSFIGLNLSAKYQFAELGKIHRISFKSRKKGINFVPIDPADSARLAEEERRKKEMEDRLAAEKDRKRKKEIEDSLKNIPPPIDTTPKFVNNRRYEISQQLSVNDRKVKIIVWDDKIVDGDIISLYLNGEPILEKYELVREKKLLEIELNKGTNDLVLYAHNLGRQPPNTAAVRVADAFGTQQVILKSDLKGSMAIQLIYNP